MTAEARAFWQWRFSQSRASLRRKRCWPASDMGMETSAGAMEGLSPELMAVVQARVEHPGGGPAARDPDGHRQDAPDESEADHEGTTGMNWHVDQDALHRDQKGAVDRVAAASLEAHVAACAECRAALMVDDDWLEQSWAGIVDRVEPFGVDHRGAGSHLGGRPIAYRQSDVRHAVASDVVADRAVTLSLVFAAMASRLAL